MITEKQKFYFTPVAYGDSVTIHKGGMKIEVDISYQEILSVISQLSDRERHSLMNSMKGIDNRF